MKRYSEKQSRHRNFLYQTSESVIKLNLVQKQKWSWGATELSLRTKVRFPYSSIFGSVLSNEFNDRNFGNTVVFQSYILFPL